MIRERIAIDPRCKRPARIAVWLPRVSLGNRDERGAKLSGGACLRPRGEHLARAGRDDAGVAGGARGGGGADDDRGSGGAIGAEAADADLAEVSLLLEPCDDGGAVGEES